ncbi:MAG: DUF1232 domain-containing protein [Gemmatimonadetes bacterium]|nr:DUF1232 domain-containing protein [Gemmatimonadota bacterium]
MASLRTLRRRRARNAAVTVLRQLPRFLRLLVRLVRDPRVSRVDKALVGLAVAYVLMPADLIPDVLGIFGMVDDIYLLGLVLGRLVANAGPDIVAEHWDGPPRALAILLDGIDDLGSLVPAPIRRLLRARVEEH